MDSFEQFSKRFFIKGFSIKSKLRQLYIQNNLKRLLKLTENDVILFTYNYGALFYQSKSVLIIHDLLFLRKEYLSNTAMRIQRRISIPISLKNATVIIAISAFTRNDILRFYKPDQQKIIVVYNFFNFDKYHISDNTELDINIKQPFILSISSLVKHKNIIVILKAFNVICKKDSNYILVFVGSFKNMYFSDREYYENLDESVRRRIIFLDKISNSLLAYLYKNCTVFVSSTLFEGLGMPIVEALYFNAPIVVSDIEVCREVSLNKALYFDPSSSEKLIQILEEYKYNVPRPNIQSEIIEIFSERNTSQKYINIINSI
jgi:glycosyltransferase involved in cell wall biosynthesis